MGDLPVSEGTIQVFNTVEETTDFIELDGGYYEFEAIPGHIYKMSFNASSENQVLVAAGGVGGRAAEFQRLSRHQMVIIPIDNDPRSQKLAVFPLMHMGSGTTWRRMRVFRDWIRG